MNYSTNGTTCIGGIGVFNLEYKVLIGHFVLGSLGIISNLLIFLPAALKKSFLKRYALLLGLAVGDFINSLGYLTSGIIRYFILARFDCYLLVSASVCILRVHVWCFLIGGHIKAVLGFLIGIERLIAVLFPIFYHKRMCWQLTWGLVFGAFSFVGVIFGAGVVKSMNNDMNTTSKCETSSATGSEYGGFNYAFKSTLGLVSAFLTVLALSIALFRLRKTPGLSQEAKFQRQLSITKSMTVVTVITLTLICLPNFMFFLTYALYPWNERDQFRDASVHSGYGTNSLIVDSVFMVLCIDSIVNLHVYLVFNTDFRLMFFRWFQCFSSQVQPVAIPRNR